MKDTRVPDDWDCYWLTCSNGHRYHASEGGCEACADMEEEGIDPGREAEDYAEWEIRCAELREEYR